MQRIAHHHSAHLQTGGYSTALSTHVAAAWSAADKVAPTALPLSSLHALRQQHCAVAYL
jgi:hypothetical protein